VAEFAIELLAAKHFRKAFDCGEESLNRYITDQASQDLKRYVAAVYVLTKQQNDTVVGYYSLSNYSIPRGSLPIELDKKLPRYDIFGAHLIGRLAVSKNLQGQKLGRKLIIDALVTSLTLSKSSGSYAVVVSAINDRAVSFYQQYGFTQFADKPGTLFLPMKTISQSYGEYD
jgi:predicted GNAT family N-acyltransferase